MLFNLVYCRLSRDRPAIPQMLNITSGSGNNGEYFSDSNDSLYGEIQQQQHQQQQQQQSFKAWLQQQHQNTASSNSSECKKVLKVWTYSKRFIFPGSNQIRAANSLDSLDCVTVWILLIVSQVLFNKLEPTVYNVDKTNNNFSNNNACNYWILIEAFQWGMRMRNT